MAVVFFDSSALVRRYGTEEPGWARVQALCRRSAGHALVVSRLARVEVASAFSRKVREGRLDTRQRSQGWRLFPRHVREQYRIVPIDEQMFELAERLVFEHPLRAYDAVHLATARRSQELLAGLAPDFRFCTADRAQAQAATGEGLTVELIQ